MVLCFDLYPIRFVFYIPVRNLSHPYTGNPIVSTSFHATVFPVHILNLDG